MSDVAGPLFLVMIARTSPEDFAAFIDVEDRFLSLLADHGLVLERRLRATSDHTEIHIIRAPDREAVDGYRQDPRRLALKPRFDALDLEQTILSVDEVGASAG